MATKDEPVPVNLQPNAEMGREEDLGREAPVVAPGKNVRTVSFGKNVWLDDKGKVLHVGNAHDHPNFIAAGTPIDLTEAQITEVNDALTGVTGRYDLATDQIAAARAAIAERDVNEPDPAQQKWADATLAREDPDADVGAAADLVEPVKPPKEKKA